MAAAPAPLPPLPLLSNELWSQVVKWLCNAVALDAQSDDCAPDEAAATLKNFCALRASSRQLRDVCDAVGYRGRLQGGGAGTRCCHRVAERLLALPFLRCLQLCTEPDACSGQCHEGLCAALQARLQPNCTLYAVCLDVSMDALVLKDVQAIADALERIRPQLRIIQFVCNFGPHWAPGDGETHEDFVPGSMGMPLPRPCRLLQAQPRLEGLRLACPTYGIDGEPQDYSILLTPSGGADTLCHERLQVLNLSGVHLRMRAPLQLPGLKKLILRDCSMAGSGRHAEKAELADAESQEYFLATLESMVSLRQLYLCHLRSFDRYLLGRLLQRLAVSPCVSTLRLLDMDETPLHGDTLLELLTAAIVACQQLESLMLDNTEVLLNGTEQCQAFYCQLGAHPRLHLVDFRGNDQTAAELQEMIDTVSQSPSLRWLCIDRYDNDGAAPAVVFRWTGGGSGRVCYEYELCGEFAC